MAVGESQILGQMRDSLAGAQRRGQAGESLNALFQGALRVGKRAHAETDIDQHSVSLVQIALEEASAVLGPLHGAPTAVVGAGGMSGLAAATARRQGVDALVGAGISSILNFAPAVLSVPSGVDVRRVDLSTELQILAFHAQRKSLAAGDLQSAVVAQ
jgi:hypothetical protein